jgi:RNA methyltransferase, TrmH family
MHSYPAISRRQRAHADGLKQKKHREECGQLLLEGARLIADALATAVPIPLAIIASDRLERHRDLLAELDAAGTPVCTASPEEMKALTDTTHSQGILAVADFVPSDASSILEQGSGPSLVTALSYVNDPGNLGTIMRTSDWFGVPGLLLSADSVDPTNPKVVRATMGSFFRVRVGTFDGHAMLLQLARERGYAIAATSSAGGTSVALAQLPARTLLVFGSEAHGLHPDVLAAADLTLTIPSRGGAESLNLAIAHGIFLSHLVPLP